MSKHNTILWLFGFALLAIFAMPNLVQDGMFLDGILYSAVSNNLAQDIGTFWRPDAGLYWGYDGTTPFWEHPPLNYWLQAWLYKLLPNSIYPERIYVALLMIGHLLLIRELWKLTSKKLAIPASLSGWPILLYLLIPLMLWSYETNIQEHSLAFFAMLSIYFTLKGVDRKGINKYVLLAALFCFLATFSKGVPGFFPLAAPLIFWFALRGKTLISSLLETVYLTGFVVFIYAILYQFEAPATWMDYYINNRLLRRISEDPTVSSHFHILGIALSQLAIPLAICLILFLWKKSATKLPSKFSSFAFAFILIGLSATLPLMLTKVQRGFYMNPAFPFFAIGLAIWTKPYLEHWMKSWRKQWISGITITLSTVILAGLIITIANLGDVKRDAAKISDSHALGAIIPSGTSIRVGNSLANDNGFKTYLVRHHYLNAHSYIKAPHKFYMRKKGSSDKVPKGFTLFPQEFKFVELYKRIR